MRLMYTVVNKDGSLKGTHYKLVDGVNNLEDIKLIFKDV